MTTPLALTLIGVAVVVALLGMALVRRLAPPGGLFIEDSHAGGVFGVVGSGFAVLLAFVIFTGFNSYGSAGENAAIEAIAVRQMYRTSELFGEGDGDQLRADLVCYARSVIDLEWLAMRSGNDSDVVDGWLDRFEDVLVGADVEDSRSQEALGHWLDQAAIRQEGRRGRISEAQPVIAPLVWLVLLIVGALTVTFVVLFADRRERFLAQAFMVVAVTTMVAAGLVVVAFLDRPYGEHGGSVRPTAMAATLRSMEETIDDRASALISCDATGLPV